MYSNSQMLRQHTKSLSRALNSSPSGQDVRVEDSGAFAVGCGSILLDETFIRDWGVSKATGPHSVLIFPVMEI